MKKFLTKNFISLLILGLFAIVYIQQCSRPAPSIPKSKIDTVTVIKEYFHDSIIRTKPQIINTIIPGDEIPAPDTTYAGLRRQYDSLSQAFYSKNIEQDSIKIDSLGTVSTIDTVGQNKILGREWKYNLKTRQITNTITIREPYKPRTQVYIGGGIIGNNTNLVQGVELETFLKNKKDQIFGLSTQKLLNQPISFGVKTYWKIKFHK